MLLCGPSGGGKSTLLRALAGVVPQLTGGDLTGELRILGCDPTRVPPRELAAMGVAFVFQDPAESIVAGRVFEEVAFGPQNLGLSGPVLRERVQRALHDVGLPAQEGTMTRTLSAGQQQRLALAGALAMRPRLLLADEPTAHLDPASAAEILALLATLPPQGITVVVAEHRLAVAAPLAGRVIAIAHGRIVADGPSRVVFADPTLGSRDVPIPVAARVARVLGLPAPLPLTAAELASAIAR
ncbi:MAG: hypothetical protein NVSMB8_03560 [Candidatus Limnocylindrales bacterium]